MQERRKNIWWYLPSVQYCSLLSWESLLPATDAAYNSHWFPYKAFHASCNMFAVFPVVLRLIFLLLFLSTALQGQDFSRPSVYSYSEFTPFSSSLTSFCMPFPEKINFQIAQWLQRLSTLSIPLVSMNTTKTHLRNSSTTGRGMPVSCRSDLFTPLLDLIKH